MTNHTYRVIEIVGTSPDSVDAAIRNGLARAAKTTRGLDWFDVQSVRGHLEDGAVALPGDAKGRLPARGSLVDRVARLSTSRRHMYPFKAIQLASSTVFG